MRLPRQQSLRAGMLSFSQFLIWDDLVWIFKRNDTQVSKRSTSSLCTLQLGHRTITMTSMVIMRSKLPQLNCQQLSFLRKVGAFDYISIGIVHLGNFISRVDVSFGMPSMRKIATNYGGTVLNVESLVYN